MITETYDDIYGLWSKAFLDATLDSESKNKLITESLESTGAATKLFKVVEAQLDKNGGRFITGD